MPAQTRELLDEATDLVRVHSFRCVDVEGGTVDRLRDALAPMPSAQAVAQAARATGKDKLIHEHGELVAHAVQAFGFNTTLAPVLDLALPASAQVMGTRAAAATAAGRGGICAQLSGRTGGAGRGGLRQAFSRAGRRRSWIRIWKLRSIQRSLRRTESRRPGALSRTAQRTAHDDGEPRGLSRYSGRAIAPPAYRLTG